jgi:hypothetical protein
VAVGLASLLSAVVHRHSFRMMDMVCWGLYDAHGCPASMGHVECACAHQDVDAQLGNRSTRGAAHGLEPRPTPICASGPSIHDFLTCSCRATCPLVAQVRARRNAQHVRFEVSRVLSTAAAARFLCLFVNARDVARQMARVEFEACRRTIREQVAESVQARLRITPMTIGQHRLSAGCVNLQWPNLDCMI